MDNFLEQNRCDLNKGKNYKLKHQGKIILIVFLKKVKENFLEQFMKELNYVLI